MRYSIGLDLGQRRDPAAIAIVEKSDQSDYYYTYRSSRPAEFHVRYAARFPLGTPYPAVVEAVREFVRDPELAGHCALAVDTTGLGGPVVDMFRHARLACHLSPVAITGGDRETFDGSQYNVPKTDLIAGIQLLLEQGRLKISKTMPAVGQLVRELLAMRQTQHASGRAGFGAAGAGEHDDLVIALALACWRANRKEAGDRNEGRLL